MNKTITYGDFEYKKFYKLFLELFIARYKHLEISYGGSKNFSVYNETRPYYDELVTEFKTKYNVQIGSGLLDIQKHFSKIHKEKGLQQNKSNAEYKKKYWETIEKALENEDIFGFLREINKVNIGYFGILNLNKMGKLTKYYNKKTIEKNIDILIQYKDLANNIDQELLEKPKLILY